MMKFRSQANHASTPMLLTLKHRLGVEDAKEYQSRMAGRATMLPSVSNSSREELVQEAYGRCHDFLSKILNSPDARHKLSRVQVHSRYALLGLDQMNDQENLSQDEERQPVSLWVPHITASSSTTTTITTTSTATKKTKIDHSRLQYRAKQQARQATVANRSIPPLLPEVAERIVHSFGDRIEVVTNGGIASIGDAIERGMMKGNANQKSIHGVMVGRAAINHPCAFADIDSILLAEEDNNKPTSKTAKKNTITRRDVLQLYAEYCDVQERDMERKRLSQTDIITARRVLVAPVYHILAGEDGGNDYNEDDGEASGTTLATAPTTRHKFNPNATYQRCLKKLMSRPQRHSSGDTIRAAMMAVDGATPAMGASRTMVKNSLDKALSDHVPIHVITERQSEYSHLVTRRSGTFQKTIY
jgi:hypothetical protein